MHAWDNGQLQVGCYTCTYVMRQTVVTCDDVRASSRCGGEAGREVLRCGKAKNRLHSVLSYYYYESCLHSDLCPPSQCIFWQLALQ